MTALTDEVSTTVLTDVVPLARRGMFSAYSNVLVGLGVALGPLLGGLLNDTLGWRVAFWVQLPIFVPAWYCNYLYLDYDHHPRDNDKAGKSVWEWVVKTDLLGCLLLALTLALALIPVSMLGASPGSDGYTLGQPAIFAPLGGSVITFVLLLFVELRFAREPILPFTMLRSRTAVSVSLYNFLASVELYAIVRSRSSCEAHLTTLDLYRPALLHDCPTAHTHVGWSAPGVCAFV